jgi:hypothetical protein
MTINVLLSTIILVSFIVTIILAVGSYVAYKVRERRRPVAMHLGDAGEPVFFERFFPARPEAATADVRQTGPNA